MDIPRKRKSENAANAGQPNRSQRRAAQRGNSAAPQDTVDEQEYVPAPPAGACMAWHYYWCDGHQEWHHHEESAVDAILESLTP